MAPTRPAQFCTTREPEQQTMEDLGFLRHGAAPSADSLSGAAGHPALPSVSPPPLLRPSPTTTARPPLYFAGATSTALRRASDVGRTELEGTRRQRRPLTPLTLHPNARRRLLHPHQPARPPRRYLRPHLCRPPRRHVHPHWSMRDQGLFCEDQSAWMESSCNELWQGQKGWIHLLGGF